MDKDFNSFIFSLRLGIFDSDFENLLIELAEESKDFRNDVLSFCQKNHIYNLNTLNNKDAVNKFQTLVRFCCKQAIYYGLGEPGDNEIYTY